MSVEVNGIAHIQLTVNDAERCLPFWERLCPLEQALGQPFWLLSCNRIVQLSGQRCPARLN